MLYPEAVNLKLPLGAKAQMDDVLREGEDRLDLIREAIDREVKRRKARRLREKMKQWEAEQRLADEQGGAS